MDFQVQPRGVAIIASDSFDFELGLKKAAMLINFDMPPTPESYQQRLQGMSTNALVMSFPSSSSELEVVQQLEQRFHAKFREISGLIKLKINENKEAFKRRLAASAKRRQR